MFTYPIALSGVPTAHGGGGVPGTIAPSKKRKGWVGRDEVRVDLQ